MCGSKLLILLKKGLHKEKHLRQSRRNRSADSSSSPHVCLLHEHHVDTLDPSISITSDKSKGRFKMGALPPVIGGAPIANDKLSDPFCLPAANLDSHSRTFATDSWGDSSVSLLPSVAAVCSCEDCYCRTLCRDSIATLPPSDVAKDSCDTYKDVIDFHSVRREQVVESESFNSRVAATRQDKMKPSLPISQEETPYHMLYPPSIPVSKDGEEGYSESRRRLRQLRHVCDWPVCRTPPNITVVHSRPS